MVQNIWPLLYATFSVAVSIGLILVIKWLAGMKIVDVGPELNLLTFGFLWDVIMKAMLKQCYFDRIWSPLIDHKPFVLAVIVLSNFVLMACNLKWTAQLDARRKFISSHAVQLRRIRVVFFGVLSLLIFLSIKTFWD